MSSRGIQSDIYKFSNFHFHIKSSSYLTSHSTGADIADSC